MIGRWTKTAEQVRSFSADVEAHGKVGRRYLGAATVPVRQIVGSVGRAHELRSDFLPLCRSWGRSHTDSRYRWVKKAMSQPGTFDLDQLHRLSAPYRSHGEYDAKPGAVLPPIELYQLGDRYYVVDGHHRVAAALSLGQVEMDAVVTEYAPARRTGSAEPAA